MPVPKADRMSFSLEEMRSISMFTLKLIECIAMSQFGRGSSPPALAATAVAADYSLPR